MREILFKAKRRNWKELPKEQWWVEGFLTKMWGQYHIIPLGDENTAYSIDEETICQYTGSNDRNGKRIWENDIIRYMDDIINKNKEDLIKWNETHASFVRLHKSQMGLQYLYIDEAIANRCEVIGDIFDNQELLE